MSTVYPTFFDLAHVLLRLTYRTQQWTCFRWSTSRKPWRYSFAAKLSRV